jgi:hypothetical protein
MLDSGRILFVSASAGESHPSLSLCCFNGQARLQLCGRSPTSCSRSMLHVPVHAGRPASQ